MLLLRRSDCFITEYVKNHFWNMHAMNHMAPKRNKEREVEVQKSMKSFVKHIFNTFFHGCLGVRNKLVGISVSLCFTRN